MELRISYRPFSKTLAVWDALDDILTDEARQAVTHVKDDDDEEFFISVGTLDGEFHNLMAMDCFNRGRNWVKMMEGVLPNATIVTLAQYIEDWQAEFDAQYGNDTSGLAVNHRASLTV